MTTDLNILNGHLTVYQISEAIDLPLAVVKDLLDKKISVLDLDSETREKLKELEHALYND